VIKRVRFTPPARAQFLAALAYIRADRPSAALDFRNRVNESLARLEQFPESGRMIPEFPQLRFREVIVGSHRFFYRSKGDTVWVVAAWHEAQVPEKPSEPPTGG
jgi:toxin ParE1/3/4